MLDYFGTDEEGGVFRFARIDNEMVRSALNGVEQINVYIEDFIQCIDVINETQHLVIPDCEEYLIELTRAIIFKFNGYEISFEKDFVFSQEIIINKGNNLSSKLVDTQKFVDAWHDHDENIQAECARKIVTFNLNNKVNFI